MISANLHVFAGYFLHILIIYDDAQDISYNCNDICRIFPTNINHVINAGLYKF